VSNEPEQKSGIEIRDDEALQLVGRELLTKLGLCFRISTMYHLDNNVLIKPIHSLVDVVNRLIEHYGGCTFNNVGENYYVNTQPVKLDSVTFEVANALMKILRRMAVNEISIAAPIDVSGTKNFLHTFQKAWEAGDPELFRDGCPTPFAVRAVQAASGKKNELANARQEVLRRYAIVAMQVDSAARDLMAGHTAGMSRVRRAVQALADACDGQEPVLAAVLSLYKSTGVVAHHLTATMAICLLIGRKLGLANKALSELCMTAVLHDVALVDLPKPHEAKADIGAWRAAIERAPDATGFAMCVGGISIGSLSRAASAHEHLIPVKAISGPVSPGEMSRILAVACAYDTLTSAEPPGIDMPPDKALWAILSGAGTRFEPIACKALATTLGLYPVGTTVKLDGGQEALVIRQNAHFRFWHRPHVLILGGLGLEVDLSQSSRRVVGVGAPLGGDVITEYFINAPDREQAPPEPAARIPTA
jgi:HD-GYP domain-containing protein (c-di-GMP phosphodiesterase class II)